MLAAGAVKLIAQLHGEPLTVISGTFAGQTFFIVKETLPELIFEGIAEAPDNRAKRIIRFDNSLANPTLQPEDHVQIGPTTYIVLDLKQDGYLTTDYTISELINGTDS